MCVALGARDVAKELTRLTYFSSFHFLLFPLSLLNYLFLALPIYLSSSLNIPVCLSLSLSLLFSLPLLFSSARLLSHCPTPSFLQFNSLFKKYFLSSVILRSTPHSLISLPSAPDIPPFVPSTSISLPSSLPHVTSPVGVTFTGSVTRADAMPCPFTNCSWASPLIPLPFSSARLLYNAFCAPDPPK